MPTTAKGTPYVVSTDLVANYPTVSSDLADHIDDNLAYNAVSINAQTGTTYTFALADASEGKLVTASNAASSTYTVPPQSSVTWAAGAVLRILNQGAGVVTIAAGAGVTINGTPLTLAQYKGAAIQRTASNTWTFVPFSGGVGNADFSDAATGTYTSGGVNYKYISYTASGTLTVTTAGFADVLVVGGGGGGFWGGGGAGGHYYLTNAYLEAGSLTITVGAGGTSLRSGNVSRCGSYYSPGGGDGRMDNGGSGGGGFNTGALGGVGIGVSGLGNNGGTADNTTGSGGGGAGAAGGNSTSNVGSAGGAGLANSITGSSVTRAGGGGGSGSSSSGAGGSGGGGAGSYNSAGTAGTANTGGGGGGDVATGVGGSGGSGVVIIRVAV